MEQRKKTCVAHGLLEFVTSKKKRSPSFNNAMTFAPAHTLTPTSARTQISARRRFAYLSISTALGWLSVHAVYRSMRDGGQTAAVPENRPGWGGGRTCRFRWSSRADNRRGDNRWTPRAGGNRRRFRVTLTCVPDALCPCRTPVRGTSVRRLARRSWRPAVVHAFAGVDGRRGVDKRLSSVKRCAHAYGHCFVIASPPSDRPLEISRDIFQTMVYFRRRRRRFSKKPLAGTASRPVGRPRHAKYSRDSRDRRSGTGPPSVR